MKKLIILINIISDMTEKIYFLIVAIEKIYIILKKYEIILIYK